MSGLILPRQTTGAGHRRVLHACPECPPLAPKPLCVVCGGHGLVDDRRLDWWQAAVISGRHTPRAD